ncbi:MAG TPA: DUF4388 domain-containing protein [Candidatus Aminicenantes bacterium]|nr:DUF4388 domain-containing protein [Candidatus Aminicenantes bacterium]
MDSGFSPCGNLAECDFAQVLRSAGERQVSGRLRIAVESFEKSVHLSENRVLFTTSSVPEDHLGNYLVRCGVIDQEVYAQSSRYMLEKKIRHGRALQELGVLNGERLWTSVIAHMKQILFSLLPLTRGTYEFYPGETGENENIRIDESIPDLILEGVRTIRDERFLTHAFLEAGDYYLCRPESEWPCRLKPHELHVVQLVRRHVHFTEIVKRSELLPRETLKTLYLLRALGLISATPPDVSQAVSPVASALPVAEGKPRPLFSSFEECLRFYNAKYAIIFRTLSKEIGPVALTILHDAIRGIQGSIPAYFQNFQLAADGTIDEKSIMKSMWYLSFADNVAAFLTGLEEILYAQVYAVRKHLGAEFEQQVLQWIQESGN